ncbi:diacylglycerol/lipid kinase family protein [Streptomyces alboniger]|uniref:DAGKc domain-containing protein n=1 Tax=Streptomyces alboniger TaxID=132473 RepID=A0A5J6HGV2_STRAD|nr:diacylglycerol kinase family protein [Streptomyces alboniger]QEV16285.1 hypothetical protein CP975_01080 [Streptomyces alboniger]
MRARVVVNATATRAHPPAVTAAVRELTAAMSADVTVTAYPGHATQLARDAHRNGFALVVVVGGDGTVNEVANGLLAEEPDGGPTTRPALGVVPAGGMNVVGRTLGMPVHPVHAARELAAAVREGRRTVVNLGKLNDRYFVSGAGVGFGAELMARVQEARRAGRSATWGRYLAEGARHFLRGTDRESPLLTVAPGEGSPADRVFAALVANTSPYAYLGTWPLTPCPRASFHTDLEALALTDLSGPRCAALMTRMLLLPHRDHSGRSARRFTQQTTLSVTASHAVALHVDGEPLPASRQAAFSSSPRALAVVA